MTTPFDTQVSILQEVHDAFVLSDETEYKDFVKFHDLTFAYLLGLGVGHIVLTTAGEELISHAFSSLLKDFKVEDKGFATLDNIVGKNLWME